MFDNFVEKHMGFSTSQAKKKYYVDFNNVSRVYLEPYVLYIKGYLNWLNLYDEFMFSLALKIYISQNHYDKF